MRRAIAREKCLACAIVCVAAACVLVALVIANFAR